MLRSELPHLTQAQAPLTREVTVVNEWGEAVTSTIPCERALTVYVDKRELVTLMTLGGHPELLVLGYLRNQRLVQSVDDIASITVDWEVGAAAVKTRNGIERLEERTAKRVVTTGCGQGSVFGGIMDDLDLIHLTPATLLQEQLYGIVNAIRVQDSIYKEAGSVHGCALFQGDTMLVFIEDVGRHNAIDTIAGWMWMGGQAPTLATSCAALPPEGVQFALGRPCGESILGSDKVLYTTGRLTSEMVIKSAQMGIPIAVSRSGITEMGLEVAQRVGLCAIGRATHKRFLCYSAFERLLLQPELAGARLRAVA
jgi:FdhD protein